MSIADLCDIISLEGTSTEEWLEGRKAGVGGSDAGVLAGFGGSYNSTYSLWAEKTGRYQPEEAGVAASWGNLLEDVVGTAYAVEKNVAVVKWNVSLRSKERPHALANIDFWICDDPMFEKGKLHEWNITNPITEPPGIVAILETKTAGIATHGTAHKWNGGAIPESYQLQVVHYATVSGVHTIHFGALLAGQGLVTRDLAWDEDLAQNLIILEDAFWQHVVDDVPPEPDGSDATESALKQVFSSDDGTVFPGGQELLDLWATLEDEKAIEAKAIADRKATRAKILAMIGNHTFGAVDGQKILSYKAGKDREEFDEKAFARDNPEEYKAYLKKKPGHRTLRKAS